jgi:hypothetical protein
MARNDLDVVSMERLIADQAGLATLRGRSSAALGRHILSELRLSGAYEQLAERARRKSDLLAAMSAGRAGAPSGSQALALRLWYFEQRLQLRLPDDVEDFARRLGFADVADFDAVLLRERLYLNAQEPGQSA